MPIPYVGVELAKIIDDERKAHADEFRSATESRSVLDTYLYSDPYNDIYIKDNPAVVGSEPTTLPFWESPDIWVRNANDGKTIHQDTIRGQDNYVYVRVRNKGNQVSGEITVNLFRANFIGTEFLYPEDWRLEDRIGTQTVASVPAQGSVVLPFTWSQKMIPPATWHPCLLAEILPIHRTNTLLRNVNQDRRIAQKNITIVNVAPSSKWFELPFSIGSRSQPARWVRVSIQQNEGGNIAEVALDLGKVDWPARVKVVGHLEGPPVDPEDVRSTFLNNLARGGKVSEREGRSIFLLSDAHRGGDIALPLLQAERRELRLRVAWVELPPNLGSHIEVTQLDAQNKTVGGLKLTIGETSN